MNNDNKTDARPRWLWRFIRLYRDPAIGSPILGWRIRFTRTHQRGFGIWRQDWGLCIGFWWVRRIEIIQIVRPLSAQERIATLLHRKPNTQVSRTAGK